MLLVVLSLHRTQKSCGNILHIWSDYVFLPFYLGDKIRSMNCCWKEILTQLFPLVTPLPIQGQIHVKTTCGVKFKLYLATCDVNTGTLFGIGAPQSQGQFCSWQSTSTGGLLARGVTSNFLLIDFLLSVTRRLLEEQRFVTGGTCCSGGKIWMSDCTPMVTVHRVWKIPMPGKINWSSNCVHRFCWRFSPSSHSSKAIIFKPQNIFESLFELVSWMLYEMPKFSEALTAIDYFAVQTGICWHKPGSNTSPWSTKEKTYCFKFSLAYFII